jgi:hypothetical protein
MVYASSVYLVYLRLACYTHELWVIQFIRWSKYFIHSAFKRALSAVKLQIVLCILGFCVLSETSRNEVALLNLPSQM